MPISRSVLLGVCAWLLVGCTIATDTIDAHTGTTKGARCAEYKHILLYAEALTIDSEKVETAKAAYALECGR